MSKERNEILKEVQANLETLKGGTCHRCEGEGRQDCDDDWVVVRKRTQKSCEEGKICFLCNGEGTLNYNIKKSALQIGLGYYYSIYKTGSVDFGSMIHWYVKSHHNAYRQAIMPLVTHINRVLIQKAIAGELKWNNDPLCWDDRCYSYIGYAMLFADIVPPDMRE